MDLALNNLRGLICHKTQTNKQTNRNIKGFDGKYFAWSKK